MDGLLAYNTKLDKFLEFDVDNTEYGTVCHVEWVNTPTKAYYTEESFFNFIGAYIGAEMAKQLILEGVKEDKPVEHSLWRELEGMVHNIFFVPCQIDAVHGTISDINHEDAYSINTVFQP